MYKGLEKIKGSIKLIIFIMLCLLFFLRHAYNELVDEEHFLHIAHGKLKVEIQRKQDLVKRCREAVEEYRNLEEKIHSHLITLNSMIRSHVNNSMKLEKQHELFELVQKMDILKEQFPALKSKDPYVFLMETIQDSGWRVTRARLNYNERIYEYNIMCRIFPYKYFAWLLGFEEKLFLENTHHDRNV